MALTPSGDCGCPNDGVLAAFLRSELPPAESDAIRSHLAACPTCDSRVRSSLPSSPPASPTAETGDFHYGSRENFNIAGLLALPQSQAPAGRPRIGQYQLVQQIGKGGMGVVYRAQHLRLKRWVALKLLSDHWWIDSNLVARFEREMEVIGRLDHPNIVRATDAGCADGYHYLAMELIDGFNLLQIVRSRCELSVADACEMIRQTAIGLQHAHEHGLVHRDIKPNNLMVSVQGVVKVLDLGLARICRTEEGEGLTGFGAIIGTPDYMAPEQWEASKDADIRADIYSLGCTLHTLLAREPPFSGPGLDAASRKMAAHLQATPPRLGEICTDVPTGVQAAIDRAMAKDPNERFQSPIELAEALTEFTSGADLVALIQRAKSAGLSTIDWSVHRDPAPASTANYASQPSAETVGPAPVTPELGRRRRVRVWLAAGLVLVLAVVSVVVFAPRRGTEEQPESPDLQPKVNLKPKPNEWFDLLAVEPSKAVWPKGKAGADSAWKYDAQKGELWIHAIQRVMLRLAEIEDVDFELEVTISQHPWRGNVGVYFADRTSGKHQRADLIALDGFDFTKAEPMVPLVRGRIDHDRTQFLGSVYDHSIRVPNPSKPDCKLWLTASQAGQLLVQWEGQTRATVLRQSKEPMARGTAGAIGVYVEDSTSVIRQARLRITVPNP